jgi:hypothetical protein
MSPNAVLRFLRGKFLAVPVNQLLKIPKNAETPPFECGNIIPVNGENIIDKFG